MVSCFSEGIPTVYIEILASLNLVLYFSMRSRKVHFHLNNAFVVLVVAFRHYKMTIIVISMYSPRWV